MPAEKVEFNEEWYNNLVSKSNEKEIIVDAIKNIVKNSAFKSCLEIGLGTTTHFLDSLSSFFEEYTVVEKELFKGNISKKVEMMNGDWEKIELSKKYDVILASHVVYYFEDKKRAIEKIFDSLNPDGIAIFVVNGKDADYGPIKQEFARLTNEKYKFTYDELISILDSKITEEVSIPSRISFDNYEDLFNSLKLSFDLYSKEYFSLKKQICSYFEKSLKNRKYFIINQKIIVCKNNLWDKLLRHEDYELNLRGIPLLIKDKVFSPNPKITYSTSQIINNLPDVKGKEILDLGCGTGAIGTYCLDRGAKKVTFVDDSKEAIKNTKINLKKNDFELKSETIRSNLFEKVNNKFDYIFANLPILSEFSNSNIDPKEINLRFLKECKNHINSGRKVYFTWASFGDISQIINNLSKLNYSYKIIQANKLGYIWYLIEIQF